jgi:hypothetical protein
MTQRPAVPVVGGQTSLTDFVKVHRPTVIVFDLVPPYDRNYRFIEHLRETEALNGCQNGCQFVLTSTNPTRAQELAGTLNEVYEVIGKPYDLDRITRAVKEASRARPTR